MSAIDVKCPICGKENKSLDLEETDGWMECEGCGNTVQLMQYVRTKKIPVYRMNECASIILLSLSRLNL